MKKLIPIFLLILFLTVQCGSEDSQDDNDQQHDLGEILPDEDEITTNSGGGRSKPIDPCEDDPDDCEYDEQEDIPPKDEWCTSGFLSCPDNPAVEIEVNEEAFQ